MTAILGRPTDEFEADWWHALARVPGLNGLWSPQGSSWHASGVALNSQRAHRIPYDDLLWVTPLDSCDASEPICVHARDISLTGLSFLHPDPLPSRRIAVSFCCDDEPGVTVEVELRWCRFTRDRHYLSGGRFLGELATNPS